MAQCLHCGSTEVYKRRRIGDSRGNAQLFLTITGYPSNLGTNSFLCHVCFDLLKRCVSTERKHRDILKVFLQRSGETSIPSSVGLPEPTAESSTQETPPPRGKLKRQSGYSLTPRSSKRKKKLFSTTPKGVRRTCQFQSVPSVCVKVGSTKPRFTHLTGLTNTVVRNILRKRYTTAANALLAHAKLQAAIIDKICRMLHKENQEFSSPKKNAKSFFRTEGPELLNFSWKKIELEMKNRVPLSYRMLSSILSKKSGVSNPRKKDIPRLCSVFSTLISARNPRMNALQKVKGLLMYNGHIKTQTIRRLSRCGECSSYSTILSLIEKVTTHYDQPVRKWRENIESCYKDSVICAADQSQEHHQSQVPSAVCVLQDHCYNKDTVLQGDHASNGSGTSKNEISCDTQDSTYTFCSQLHMNIPSAEACTTETAVSCDTVYDETNSCGPFNVNLSSMDACTSDPAVSCDTSNDHTYSCSQFTGNLSSLGACTSDPPVSSDHDYSVLLTDRFLSDDFNDTNPLLEKSQTWDAPRLLYPHRDTSYQIIFDNLNIHQNARHKSEDNTNKQFNLIHAFAVKNRVNFCHLDNTEPIADVLSVPNQVWLLSQNEHAEIKQELKTLIQRCLVEHIAFFTDSSNTVTQHIPHAFNLESSQKSEIVPLGIFEANEAEVSQLISYMEYIQDNYVPFKENGQPLPILFGGDGLSVERVRDCKLARSDAPSDRERLKGLIGKSEDWHEHVIALQDYFNEFYSPKSGRDIGTLYQIRTRFKKHGVKSIVKESFNDNRGLTRLMTHGMIVLCALTILGMKSIDDKPDAVYVNNEFEKKQLLENLSSDIMDNYVCLNVIDNATRKGELEMENQEHGRIVCGWPGCAKTFAVDGLCRQRHRDRCLYQNLNCLSDVGERITSISFSEASTDKHKEDHKFNYSCAIMREGLMDWAREDAARESDGERIVRHWKYDLLSFYTLGHTKYSIHAFNLIGQVTATLTPRMSSELVYNRNVNFHGGLGKNFPCDLGLEFKNKEAKERLKKLGPNMNPKSITRTGKSLKVLSDLEAAYDKSSNCYTGLGTTHYPSLTKEIRQLVDECLPEKLFHRISGRAHASFPSFPKSRLENMNCRKFYKWLQMRKEVLAKDQRKEVV